jgi:F-box/leucine-rich repeat protein 7
VTKGHSNSGLYFISRGEVEVIVHDDEEEEDKERETARPKILLTEGDYFGEVSLLLNTPATATIEAVSFCDLFYISGHDFHLVKEASPDIEQTLRDARKELFDKVGDKAGDKETKKEKKMEEEEKQNAASSSSSIMSAKKSLRF